MTLEVGDVVAGRFVLTAERGTGLFEAREAGELATVRIVQAPARWRRAAERCLKGLAERPLSGTPRIRGVGRVGRALFVATDPVAGSSLADHPGPWEIVAKHLATALGTLDAVHARQIRLGAFELDAVVVTASGPILADLARCQPFGPADEVLGHPAYLAPELVAGREADGRADLFSAGVALRRLAERHPDAPDVVHELVASLLQPDPAQRPARASEAAEALLHPARARILERLGDPAVEPWHGVPAEPSRGALALPPSETALARLAGAVLAAPDAIATAEAAAELVEDLLVEDDPIAVETVLAATRAARRAHPSAFFSAARALLAAFVSVPSVLVAIDVLAASHPGEALRAIALLRRGRRVAPVELYKRAGLAYLAAGRDDRAVHYLRRSLPPERDLRREIESLRAEVRRLRARCHALEQRLRPSAPPVIDTRADHDRRQDERLRRTLRETDWNVSETARRLGISRPTVYRRMRRLGLASK